MDQSTPFQLVPHPPEQRGNFVIFNELPQDSQEQLSQWIDQSLELVVESNAQFISPVSSRKQFGGR